MNTKYQNLKELYEELTSNRSTYEPVWRDIAAYVGINLNIDYSKNLSDKGDNLDTYVEDPTAALSVTQAGEYMQGVMWGTGDEALSIEPSDWVLQRAEESSLVKYFGFRTKQLLKNMNHSRAGLNTAMKSYFYDQTSFGTSGVGAFKNSDFLSRKEEHPYVFRSYGVDNMAIDEGKAGLVDVIFITYQWRVNRIYSEFWEVKDKLPKKIQESYKNKKYNDEYTLVHAIYPREDFDPKLKGKRGAKYRGSWFTLEDSDTVIFYEEDFRKLPIGVCRAIKIRGEVYGRSSGSLLISSIKSVNYMFGKTVEILEKMASPSLGIWNSALFGDSVLDTSADGLVTFNQSLMGNAQQPVFPIHDVGDPTGIIQFLIPYLNEKIATGFKVDLLLDFSSAKDMTATESMQRYAIRGRSLSGLLQQQKIEMLEPLVDRCIQLEDDMGLRGVDPTNMAELARQAMEAGNSDVIIPDVVLAAMEKGKQWYKIKFNNELERLSRTEAVQRVLQSVNALLMIGSAFPSIVEAVDWYKIWSDVNTYLGTTYATSEKEFKMKMQKQMEIQQQMLQTQQLQAGAEAGKNISEGRKNAAEAESINSGSST